MRLLTEADRQAVLRYVCDEPAYNLFIIGDIENYGFMDKHVSIAVNEDGGRWDSLVLRYHENFVVYASKQDYDASAVASYIMAQPYDTISGKSSIVSRLGPFFADREVRSTILSRCDEMAMQDTGRIDAIIRRIEPHETVKVVDLYCVVDAFKRQYIGKEKASADRMAHELQHNGMGYGAFIDGCLVSHAQVSARNSQSAMVVGVCTHPDYRRRGLASAVMRALCNASFEGGLSFLCLFYDNPSAGRIYRSLGFKRIGEYMMLTPKRTG